MILFKLYDEIEFTKIVIIRTSITLLIIEYLTKNLHFRY